MKSHNVFVMRGENRFVSNFMGKILNIQSEELPRLTDTKLRPGFNLGLLGGR